MELHTGLIEINWTSLMILINVFILYLIMKKYFWVKIKKFMDDRSNSIKDAIDAAEAINRRADAKMSDYSRRIAGVEEESREIIKEGKRQADAQAKLIIADAHRQAEEIVAKAEETIKAEREKAAEEMRTEIASIGLMVAQQIIGRELDVANQEAIVDEVIDSARNMQWQN